MSPIILLLGLLANTAVPPAPEAPLPQKTVKGTYILYIGQKRVGTETFTITTTESGRKLSSHSKIDIDGVLVNQSLSAETSLDLHPKLLVVEGTVAGQRIHTRISFTDTTATSTSASGETKSAQVGGNAVMLAPNCVSLLAFIAWRYDRNKAGEQEFTAFPNTPVKVRFRGRDAVTLRRKEEQLDRFDMTAGGQRATVWVNRDGLPVVVSSSRGGLDAALKPYDTVREHLLLAAARFIPTEPRPAKPSTYITQEVAIPAAGFRLAGSLSIPSDTSPAPCVILVSSAGPHTRDEETAGVPIFKQIAEALAAEGFAVLRVDDRGVGASGGVMSRASVLPLAGDLQALVRYVRSRRELDPTKVALVGYGEGGEIASLVASTDPGIAALVLMATPAKTGADLCLERLHAALAPAEKKQILPLCEEALKALRQGKQTENLPPPLRPYVESPWTKAFLDYDPIHNLKLVTQPVLILHGGKDREVPPSHAELNYKTLRESGNRRVRLHIFPNLNHLFLPAQTGEPSEYPDLPKTLDQGFLSTLVQWLKDTLTSEKTHGQLATAKGLPPNPRLSSVCEVRLPQLPCRRQTELRRTREQAQHPLQTALSAVAA